MYNRCNGAEMITSETCEPQVLRVFPGDSHHKNERFNRLFIHLVCLDEKIEYTYAKCSLFT